jgi:hypothetical protein
MFSSNPSLFCAFHLRNNKLGGLMKALSLEYMLTMSGYKGFLNP